MSGWQIIFWISVGLILHSYLIFPFVLQLLAYKKRQNELIYTESELPAVTVVMSVFNEENVLAEKIDSIFSSDYPAGKIKLFLGSDASTDKTNGIIKAYAAKNRLIEYRMYESRRGKPNVINDLIKKVSNGIVVMTDAKAIFHPDAVRNLVKHFKNRDIGIVGANIQDSTGKKSGVSAPEKAFMTREIVMKYREGLVWGAAMGLYGALYAVRRPLFTPVPKGFAVDDFFITLNVLRQKKRSILEMNAITYENVPDLISEEYRRKVRIASGNYSNMSYFLKELVSLWKGASFAYFSHKVIRWMGPFILIALAISNILLYNQHLFYKVSLFAAAGLLIFSLFDILLSKIGLHIVFLRFVRHFISMNVALLHGFINYIRGITKDVWQPTNR
ncbi:MAG: glycosyltransferase [Bacteroidales bacterium]|nr:glycosyltransferase [Bacteroidales bacterium]